MKKTIFALLLLTGMAISPSVLADDKPPRNAKPLSEIIKNLENKGYSPIVDVDYDDDQVWEIKAYRNNQKRELKINPVSGDILSVDNSPP